VTSELRTSTLLMAYRQGVRKLPDARVAPWRGYERIVSAEASFPAELETTTRDSFGAALDAGRDGIARVREVLVDAVEHILDALARTVVNDPIDVHDAAAACRRIEELATEVGNAATLVGAPWLMKQVVRFARRGRAMPSAAAVAAGASVITASAIGVQQLRVLGSLLVQRARSERTRIDAAFVRRVTVGLYLDPDAGIDSVRPNARNAVRLVSEWSFSAVPILRARKTTARVKAAAEAIERLDLAAAIDAFERTRAIDLRATTRSD
jgi:hypothetical protein